MKGLREIGDSFFKSFSFRVYTYVTTYVIINKWIETHATQIQNEMGIYK